MEAEGLGGGGRGGRGLAAGGQRAAMWTGAGRPPLVRAHVTRAVDCAHGPCRALAGVEVGVISARRYLGLGVSWLARQPGSCTPTPSRVALTVHGGPE